MSQDQLQQACEVLYDELWNGVIGLTPDERMRCIARVLKTQRAAEARACADLCDQHHAKDHWYITRLRAKFEQRAKELES